MADVALHRVTAVICSLCIFVVRQPVPVQDRNTRLLEYITSLGIISPLIRMVSLYIGHPFNIYPTTSHPYIFSLDIVFY